MKLIENDQKLKCFRQINVWSNALKAWAKHVYNLLISLIQASLIKKSYSDFINYLFIHLTMFSKNTFPWCCDYQLLVMRNWKFRTEIHMTQHDYFINSASTEDAHFTYINFKLFYPVRLDESRCFYQVVSVKQLIILCNLDEASKQFLSGIIYFLQWRHDLLVIVLMTLIPLHFSLDWELQQASSAIV